MSTVAKIAVDYKRAYVRRDGVVVIVRNDGVISVRIPSWRERIDPVTDVEPA